MTLTNTSSLTYELNTMNCKHYPSPESIWGTCLVTIGLFPGASEAGMSRCTRLFTNQGV